MSQFEKTSEMEIPVQRQINYAGLVIAILAVILAVVGLFWVSSVGDNVGKLTEQVVGAEKTQQVVNHKFAVELSAENTATTILKGKVAALEGKVETLESKSVVAELAKELREGKASKFSVDVLRDEVLNKADAKTVRRLARRMGKFDKRIDNIVELNKLVEVATQPPVEQKPAPTPAPVPPPTPSKSPAPPAK